MKRTAFAAALTGAVIFPHLALAQDDEAGRAARWKDLAESIFGSKQIQNGEGKIFLETPDRALDAALVPVTIRVPNLAGAKGIYLVIDNNPAPLAAHITFGPAGDPRSVTLRVRIDQYTYMHAVAETADSALYETHRFVKASGGCSAPAGSYDEAALSKIGEMKLRPSPEPLQGQTRQVQLLIRHPNFSGMQKDPLTQGYTPARFVRTVDVAFEGKNVLHLDSDIAISSDPSVTFGVAAQSKGKLVVKAEDSDNNSFERAFDLGDQGT